MPIGNAFFIRYLSYYLYIKNLKRGFACVKISDQTQKNFISITKRCLNVIINKKKPFIALLLILSLFCSSFGNTMVS